MKYRQFHQSYPGYSHIEGNTPCQDASISWTTEQATVIIVSDGHGNFRHLRSQIGSQIACETVSLALKEYLHNPQKRLNEIIHYQSDSFAHLKESILTAWGDAIRTHYIEHPFTQEELHRLHQENLSRYADDYEKGIQIERAYGCTLVAFAITDAFWLALQLGDGEVALTDGKGRFTFPLSEDDPSIGDITHSLCEIDAKRHFAHSWGITLPAAAFVYTDGIQKAYRRQSMDLMNMLSWAGNLLQGSEVAPPSLQNYLARLAMQGTPKDDVSLAICIEEGAKLPRAKYSLMQIEREKTNCQALLDECSAILDYNKHTLETLTNALEHAEGTAKVHLESDLKMVQQILEKEQQNKDRILLEFDQWNQLIAQITLEEEKAQSELKLTINSSKGEDTPIDATHPDSSHKNIIIYAINSFKTLLKKKRFFFLQLIRKQMRKRFFNR